jgi:hypothetical protein
MIILMKIVTPDDLIDNYLKNQEYGKENELYDRMTIEMLMEYWHSFASLTSEQKEHLSYLDINPDRNVFNN